MQSVNSAGQGVKSLSKPDRYDEMCIVYELIEKVWGELDGTRSMFAVIANQTSEHTLVHPLATTGVEITENIRTELQAALNRMGRIADVLQMEAV